MGGYIREAQRAVQEAPAKAQNYVRALENDPGRMTAAGVSAGLSEAAREGVVAAGEKMKQEAGYNQGPELPAMPGQPGGTTPKETPKEDAPDARKGRASTILTGRRGLTTSPATARRTLMGV